MFIFVLLNVPASSDIPCLPMDNKKEQGSYKNKKDTLDTICLNSCV